MIAIDATPLQSEHRFRGVGAYTRHLIEHLIAKIPDELAFIATKNGIDSLPDTVRQRARVGWRSHRPAQVYWLYNELFLRHMLRSLKPSIFHATDFNGTLRLPDIPTVATLYDLTNLKVAVQGTDLSTRMSNWRWAVYYQQKLPKIDRLIAISEYVKHEAVSLLDLDPARISVIPLGIESSKFYPAPGQGRFAGRPPYVLYVGSRDPNKNLDGVLKAFSMVVDQIPEIHLAVAGRWNPEDTHWLQRHIEENSLLRSRVDHLGFVADEDMASLYSNAEVFLFPSLAEGFGFPVLEAMACGTPVVASNRDAIPEVAGNAATLIDPLDCASMASALIDILLETQKKTEYRELGLGRVQLYGWDSVARQTISVYRTAQSP